MVPLSAVLLLTNATLPVDPLKLMVVLVKSGVGNEEPVEPDAKAIKKYLPAASVVFAGIAATAQLPVPDGPVAEAY